MNERLVRAVIQLYEWASTKVKVGKGMSGAFNVKVRVHQGLVLSPFFVCNCDGCFIVTVISSFNNGFPQFDPLLLTARHKPYITAVMATVMRR